MTERLRSEYPCTMASLSLIQHDLLEVARSCSIESKRLSKLELCLEEALVNIFRYSGNSGNDPGIVEIVARAENDGQFEVEITDRGVPFNPLDAPEPDLEAPIEDRPIGGLGVHLIRKLMDDVKYRREDNKNILTLTLS